jgi:hypothetical protein
MRSRLLTLGSTVLVLATGCGAYSPPKVAQSPESHTNPELVKVVGKGNNFTFVDGSGEDMTEAEFARRYTSVTGTEELVPLTKRRNVGLLLFTGGMAVGSAAILSYGLLNLNRPCDTGDVSDENGVITATDACKADGVRGSVRVGDTQAFIDPSKETVSQTSGLMVLTGAVGLVGFGAGFIYAMLNPDGGVTKHAVSIDQARRYTNEYNKLVDRKPPKEQASIKPQIGVGFVGVSGKF